MAAVFKPRWPARGVGLTCSPILGTDQSSSFLPLMYRLSTDQGGAPTSHRKAVMRVARGSRG